MELRGAATIAGRGIFMALFIVHDIPERGR
jgi:hypothetical protein